MIENCSFEIEGSQVRVGNELNGDKSFRVI